MNNATYRYSYLNLSSTTMGNIHENEVLQTKRIQETLLEPLVWLQSINTEKDESKSDSLRLAVNFTLPSEYLVVFNRSALEVEELNNGILVDVDDRPAYIEEIKPSVEDYVC